MEQKKRFLDKAKNFFGKFSLKPLLQTKGNRISFFGCLLSFVFGLGALSLGCSYTNSAATVSLAADILHQSIQSKSERVSISSTEFSFGQEKEQEVQKFWHSAYTTNTQNSSQAVALFEIKSDASPSTVLTFEGEQVDVALLDWAVYDLEGTSGIWFGGVAVNKALDSTYIPPYNNGYSQTIYLPKSLGEQLLQQFPDKYQSLDQLAYKTATLTAGGQSVDFKIANFYDEGPGFGREIESDFQNGVVIDFLRSAFNEKGGFSFTNHTYFKNDLQIAEKTIRLLKGQDGSSKIQAVSVYTPGQESIPYSVEDSLLMRNIESVHLVICFCCLPVCLIFLPGALVAFTHSDAKRLLPPSLFFASLLYLLASIPAFLILSNIPHGFDWYFAFYSFPFSLILLLAAACSLTLYIRGRAHD